MAAKKNDLLGYGLHIYQDDSFFKFSIDSVLLAEFVNIKFRDKNVLDMCTGNAPALLIMAQKYKKNYWGIELQKKVYDLACMSVKENKLDINLINDDINNLEQYFKNDFFDIITCNPPYFKCNHQTLVNQIEEKSIARHEIKVTFEEIVSKSYNLLKNNGYFYFVHRTDRLLEFIYILNKYHFSVKRIRFAYDNYDSNCCCVLFECVKNGHTETKVEKPLFLNKFLKEAYK